MHNTGIILLRKVQGITILLNKQEGTIHAKVALTGSTVTTVIIQNTVRAEAAVGIKIMMNESARLWQKKTMLRTVLPRIRVGMGFPFLTSKVRDLRLNVKKKGGPSVVVEHLRRIMMNRCTTKGTRHLANMPTMVVIAIGRTCQTRRTASTDLFSSVGPFSLQLCDLFSNGQFPIDFSLRMWTTRNYFLLWFEIQKTSEIRQKCREVESQIR
ncbi:unnamed protein product [Amoebophrya sp. A25]|nr:unnamed protein product [Amoebophrya sp. A25]|eukprot:GSA25T00010069001.1